MTGPMDARRVPQGWLREAFSQAVTPSNPNTEWSPLAGGLSSSVFAVGNSGRQWVVKTTLGGADKETSAHEILTEAQNYRLLAHAGPLVPHLVTTLRYPSGRDVAAVYTWLPGQPLHTLPAETVGDLACQGWQATRHIADTLPNPGRIWRTWLRTADLVSTPGWVPAEHVQAWQHLSMASRHALDHAQATRNTWLTIHRDLHHGNILSDGSTITGIIDWGQACTGPVDVDLARLRINLHLAGLADAATHTQSTLYPEHHSWLLEALTLHEMGNPQHVLAAFGQDTYEAWNRWSLVYATIAAHL